MKTKKIISIIVLAIIFSLMMALRVEAASVSIYANNNEVTVGTKVTITISGNAAAWDLQVSGTGISTTPIVGYTSDAENGKFSKTISFTPKSTGKYTINLNGNITDESSYESTKVNKSINITVKAKSSGGGSSGSSGSNNSGNSGSGSSSSGNSDGTSKPKAPSFTTVNETVYATDSVNVRSSYSTNSSIIGSLNKGQSVTRIGKSSSWSKVKYNGQTAYISSDYLTTKKPEESNNKNLKALSISGEYKLTPEFDKDITEYNMTVGEDVDSLDIKATAEDSSAKIEISGNDKILTGENVIEVKVTAEDGTVRTYKINVTKGEETLVPSFGLTELSIEGYTLSPEFDKGIYEYKLDIADPSVTSLKVNAKSDEENAVIDITGNDELKLGENIITIIAKSEDGKEVVTYQIVVNITEKVEENNQLIAGIDNNDLYMYIGIGVAVLVVIIIIIVIIKRKNRDEDDYETYYGGFNSLDKTENNSNFNNFSESKENSNISNNDNTENKNLGTIKDDLNTDSTDKNKDRKSVIEENFGTGIDYNNFTDDDDRIRRRKGKHSK